LTKRLFILNSNKLRNLIMSYQLILKEESATYLF